MKATLKHFVAAAVLATSSFAASAAAPTFDLGVVDGYAEYKNRFTSAVGAFTDTFGFELPTWADASGSTTSKKLVSRTQVSDLDITDFYITTADGSKTYTGVQTASGVKEEWEFDAVAMAPGKYVMYVVGNVIGNAGGNYAGQLSTLSVVPEASTLAMMLAGMGLVGAITRRRKTAQPVSGAYAAA